MHSPRIQQAQSGAHYGCPKSFPAQPTITVTWHPTCLHSFIFLIFHSQVHLLRGCPVNPFPRIPTLCFVLFFSSTPNSFLNSLLLILWHSLTLYPPSTFLRYFHSEKRSFCPPSYGLSVRPHCPLYNPICSARWNPFFLNTFYVASLNTTLETEPLDILGVSSLLSFLVLYTTLYSAWYIVSAP